MATREVKGRRKVQFLVSGRIPSKLQTLQLGLSQHLEEYGSVTDLTVCRDANKAKFAMDVNELSASQITRKKVEIEGTKLTILKADDDDEDEDEDSSSDDETSTISTIVVENLPSNFDENTLNLYFSHERKSLGGRIQEHGIKIDGTKGFITFCDPQVAARVVNKPQHNIKRCPVSVSLHVPVSPPKSADDMLLLKNIPKNFKPDNLELFLDVVTDLEYDEEDYAYDIKQHEGETLILVTFYSDIDLDNVIENISQEPLTQDGHYISAERVPECTSVILKNIQPDRCNKTTLNLYFHNQKKSGVKSYKNITIVSKTEAIVEFDNDESVKSVTSKKHNFLGKHVSVLKYDFLSSLGGVSSPLTSSSDEAEESLESTPASVSVVPNTPFQKQIAKAKLDFCKQHDQVAILQSSLTNLHASLSIDEEGYIIITPVSGNETVKNWKEECSQLIDKWLRDFDYKEIHIHTALQHKIYRLIVKVDKNSLLSPLFYEEESLLKVVGKSDKVAEFCEKVETLQADEIVEKENIEIDEKKMVFITEIRFKQLKQQFPSVIFTKVEQQGISLLQIEGKKQDRKHFIQHLDELKFYCEQLPLAEWVLEFLSTPVGEAMARASLKQLELNVALLIHEDMFSMIAAEKASITQASKAIKSIITHKTIEAPSQFRMAYHDRSWTSLCEKIESSHSVKISVPATEDCVIIAGDNTCFAEIANSLEQFFIDKCYNKERTSIKSGQWKYIKCHALEKWTKLLADAEKKGVKIVQPELNDDNPIVTFEGDPAAIQKLLRELKRLTDMICTNNPLKKVARPGTVRFLTSDEGQTFIIGIEQREKSCIQMMIEDPKITEPAIEKRVAPKHVEKCKANTKQGKMVTLLVGDITELAVDVIVNAANCQLDHVGGVAGAIVRKGGQVIQKDSQRFILDEGELFEGDAIIRKTVGNLPCQALIHAVGPKWKGGRENEKACLALACIESLKLAESRYSSIAFPAISAGIYGYPAQECAQCMIESFVTWSKGNPTTILHNIYVVVSKATLSDVFATEMEKQLQILPHYMKDENSNDNESESLATMSVRQMMKKKHALPAAKSHTVPMQPMMLLSQQAGGLDQTMTSTTWDDDLMDTKDLFILKQGELLKHSADVYVNTAGKDLDLRNGAVAQSLLKAGGQALQDECTSYVATNGEVPIGGVVVTGPGSLPCKYVIHTVGPTHDGVKSEKILENIITETLQQADSNGATSIAFPALGAGNLRFPSHTVAKIMVETIASYTKRNQSTTNLKAVKLVIFMRDTFKEFEKVLSTQSFGQNKGNKKKYQKVKKTASASQPVQSMASPPQNPVSLNNGSFTIGTVTIEILSGDITEQDSDVVVHPTNERLQLGGGVGKALLRKAGRKLETSLNDKASTGFLLKEGKVFATPATGQLQCTFIYHVVSPEGGKAQILSKTINTCLKKAEEDELSSISFPAIGTAVGTYQPADAAKCICEAIAKYANTNPKHVNTVRIVIFMKQIYEIFIQTCNDMLQSPQSGWLKSTYNYVTSLFSASSDTKSDSSGVDRPELEDTTERNHGLNSHFAIRPKENSVLLIEIFAGSKQQVEKTEKRIDELVHGHHKTDTIADERVGKLTEDHSSFLQKKASQHHVQIKIKQNLNRIHLIGDKEDVGEIKTEIFRIFGDVIAKEGIEKAAMILQEKVTWKWFSDDQNENYNYIVNYEIEQAYQKFLSDKQESIFTYEEGDQSTIIDFNMKAEIIGNDQLSIKRCDIEDLLQDAEYPVTWTDMDKLDEKACHVVDLDAKDTEYKEISNTFESSMPQPGLNSPYGNWNGSIVKIQRIQNPALYAQYAGRKKIMDKTYSRSKIQIERRLFHGCAGGVATNIYHQGFNRSFAGKNATFFGEGAYFAVSATYSARPTYSPPEPNGDRFMFYASVLTGEYTKGSGSLKVPPPKDPNKSNVILFDSVVDDKSAPNMFVVFSDAQCYPDYLITFQ